MYNLSPTSVFLLSLLAAVIPTLFYVAIIYWVDRYEKEPFWLLTAAFLWGAVPSIIIAFIFNTIASIPLYLLVGNSAGDTLVANLIAPPVEESLKGVALLAILLIWRHEIDSPLDGIIYGAMVGMGFAMVENVFYFVNVYNTGGPEAWGTNIFMRGVVFGLNHALFSSITGLSIALARETLNNTYRFALPVIGWLGAIFLHFLHNVSVSPGNLLCLVALITDWGGVGLILIIIAWALLQERRWLKKYLIEEVNLGTLTVNQFYLASSSRKRNRQALRVLFSKGLSAYVNLRRFYQSCSELAYKKHHFARFRSEKGRKLLEEARQETIRLGALIA